MLAGLDGRIAAVVDGGPCRVGVESTVLDLCGSAPFLLRPGGVTAEAIEALVGPIGRAITPAEAETTRTLRSPGLLVSHYAPGLPVRLNADSVERRRRRCWRSGHPWPGAGAVFELSRAADVTEAASRLFEGLRWLDREGARLGLVRIAAMAVPDGWVGRGDQRPAAAGGGAQDERGTTWW